MGLWSVLSLLSVTVVRRTGIVEVHSLRTRELVPILETNRGSGYTGGQAWVLGSSTPRPLHVGREPRRKLHLGNLGGPHIPCCANGEAETRHARDSDSLPPTRNI